MNSTSSYQHASDQITHAHSMQESIKKSAKVQDNYSLLAKKIQAILNLGLSCPEESHHLLSKGYSIIHDTKILARFQRLILKNDPEMMELFKLATPKGGLFVKYPPIKIVQREYKDDPAFKQIRDKIKCGFLEEAKEELGDFLKSIEGENLEKSIAGFQLMSEVHLLDDKFPEAAAILWYAKRLRNNESLDSEINTLIDDIERTFLQKFCSQICQPKGIAQSKLDKEKLQLLREDAKEKYDSIKHIEDNLKRAQEMRKLYSETITKGIKIFIHELAKNVMDQMEIGERKAPCEYALIGLGSLAREEMTPYSDFEFAILIDSDKEDDKKFFRLFTLLLHLRFINLGETILPSLNIHCLDWVFDTLTPRGLSFDGSMPNACKTPLGKQLNRKGDYELILNPEKMSELQFIDAEEDEQKRLWVLQRYHLPSILSACTYVSGSEKGRDLVSDYQKKVQTILKNGEGKKRASDLMKHDLVQFKPTLDEEDSGKHYNVKKDIYRLPNTMFDGLANYFCLEATTTWERIEELEKKGKLTLRGSQDLQELVMLSQELRLSTYFKHEKQKDHLDLDTQKINLEEVYYRALPFAEAMENFCFEMERKEETAESYLKQERFYQNSDYHRGVIALRQLDFPKAERYLDCETIDTLEYCEALGAIKNILGKYKEAENAYQKAIEKKPSCNLWLKLGLVRQSLAVYKGENSAEEAFLEAKKLAQESNKGALLEGVYRALIALYLDYGDFAEMNKFLILCKESSKRRLSGKKKDPEYDLILDLDLAKQKELEARILKNLEIDFQKADKLFGKALRIFIGYYRREDHPTVMHYEIKVQKYSDQTILIKNQMEALRKFIIIFGEIHPDVATSNDCVGATLKLMGKHNEALKYQNEGLRIRTKIFGEKHPEVAKSYNSLGDTLGDLGNYNEAMEDYDKALQIRIGIFGENHPEVANSYGLKAEMYGQIEENEEALEMNRKALKIKELFFNGKHPSLTGIYNNMGFLLGKLERYEESLKYHEDAIKMVSKEDNSMVAACYGVLGIALMNLNHYQDAEWYLENSLKINTKIFGENHLQVAVSHGNIGLLFLESGRYRDALQHQYLALRIHTDILGGRHPDIAKCYHNIGSIYLEQKKYSLAISSMKNALNFYQNKPYGQPNPSIVHTHWALQKCYKAIQDKKKYEEHRQESNAISEELKNKQVFQKIETKSLDFLRKKEYLNAYMLFKKLPANLQEAPQFLCPLMQLAFLCPNLNAKVRQRHIQAAESALKNQKGSIFNQMKLSLNLANYWLSLNKWNHAYEIFNYLAAILKKASTLTFQYELLDILAFGENPLVEGECIPADILRNFIALKIYRGQERFSIVPISANMLMQKIDDQKLKGCKIEEIKNFCLNQSKLHGVAK